MDPVSASASASVLVGIPILNYGEEICGDS